MQYFHGLRAYLREHVFVGEMHPPFLRCGADLVAVFDKAPILEPTVSLYTSLCL